MEIEAKFSIPDEQTFQRLLRTATLAGFSLKEGGVAELLDSYVDTADGAIRASGYACRVRRENNHFLATLKGLGEAYGGIHRRVEYEVELPAPVPPQNWPSGPARELTLRLCRGETLIPLFQVEQRRHNRSLYDGDRAVAGLNLDRVRICGDDSRQSAATYLELEAELLPDGRETDLEKLSAELQQLWGLAPENQSKFERGLAVLGLVAGADNETVESTDAQLTHQGHDAVETRIVQEVEPIELLEQPGIRPDDPMSEAGRKTLRFHYRRMLFHEPATRLGEDIEALHDMRVATRRMRSAFRVFEDSYRPKAVAPYLKGLKRTGRALGAVRDLDVFREKIRAYLRTLPSSQQDSLDELLTVLEARREAAREQMIAYLDGKKYARFREAFGEFVETEGMGSMPISPDDDEPRAYRVRHVVPMVIYERFAAMRAYDEWVSIPSPPVRRLHALRITCKRLRYALEFFEEVLSPETKTLVKKVVAMQDHLGNLQDAVVASSILGDFLRWGTWGHEGANGTVSEPETPVSAPGVEAYLATKQAERQHLLDTFPQAWQELNSAEISKMVAEAVMAL